MILSGCSHEILRIWLISIFFFFCLISIEFNKDILDHGYTIQTFKTIDILCYELKWRNKIHVADELTRK